MVKNGKFTWPVRILILTVVVLAVLVPCAVSEICKQINDHNNAVLARKMAVSAQQTADRMAASLPQDTDLTEKLYWAEDDQELRVVLLVKSNLTDDQIKDFYENEKILPAQSGYDVDIAVNEPSRDLQHELQLFEYVASAYHGSIQKYSGDSHFEDYFMVDLIEQLHTSQH